MASFERVLAALADADVRTVVVGGVAVLLHGYPRFTADIDLVIDLATEPAAAAVDALTALGLRPRLPVDARQFADPEVRAAWIRDRELTVFSMHDPSDPLREVDLFAEAPLPFEDLYARSVVVVLDPPGLAVHVASIDDLIAMKRIAGRPQDLADIEALEAIRDEPR